MIKKVHRYISLFIILSLIITIIPINSINVKANTKSGAVVKGDDGVTEYTLEHEYVQALNINTGPITITPTTYTQTNGSSGDWDGIADAYLIKGTTTTTNTITITGKETGESINVYLLDVTMRGTLIVKGNVNIIIVDNVTIDNDILVFGQSIGTVVLRGLDDRSKITAKTLARQDTSVTKFMKLVIRDLKLELQLGLRTGNGSTKFEEFSIYNSTMDIIDPKAFGNFEIKVANVIDSTIRGRFRLNHISNYTSVINIERSNIDQIHSYSYLKEMVFNIKDSLIHTYTSQYSSAVLKLNLFNSSIKSFTQSGLRTSAVFKLNESSFVWDTEEIVGTLIFNNSSFIYRGSSTIPSVSNDNADTLYAKKVRFRGLPYTYILTKFPNGVVSKLLTDMNGYIHPYVPNGTTELEFTVTDETGTANFGDYKVEFEPVNGEDTTSYDPVALVPPLEFYFPPHANTDMEYSFDNISWATTTTDSECKFKVIVPGDIKRIYIRLKDKVYFYDKDDQGNIGEIKELKLEIVNSSSSPTYFAENSSVTLFVLANPSVPNAQLTYQWYKDGVLLGGETKSTLSLVDTTSSTVGIYTCDVTDLNGTVTVTIDVKPGGNNQGDLIADLENQIALLTEQLAQANLDKGNLQTTIDILQGENTQLNELINELREQIATLTEQLGNATTDNDALVIEIENLNNRITTLESRITELEGLLQTANNEKAILELEIENLNSTVITLNIQITNLTELLNASETENEELKAKIDELLLRIEDLLGQIKTLQDDLLLLQEKNDALEKQVTDLTNANTSLIEEISNLNDLLRNANDTIADLENKIIDLEGNITNLEDQLSSANADNLVLGEKVKGLESDLADANSKIVILEDKIKILEQEKLENIENIDILEEQIRVLTEEKDALNVIITDLRDTISTLESEKMVLESTITDLNTKITELEDLIIILNERIASGDLENAELKGKITELEEKIINFELANKTLSDELITMIEVNESLKEQIRGLQEQNTDLLNEIKRLQDLLDIANETIKDLEGKVADLTDKVSVLEEQLKTANNDKEVLQGTIDGLEEELRTLNQKVIELEELIKQLQSDGGDYIEIIKNLNSTITTLNEQISTLQTELDELKIAKEALETIVDNLNIKILDLENEILRLTNKVLELEGENASLLENIDILNGRITTLENTVTDLINEISDLNDLNDLLQSQLDDANSTLRDLRILIDEIKKELGIEDDEDIIPTIKDLKDRLLNEIAKNKELQDTVGSITKDLEKALSDNKDLNDKLEGLKELVGADDVDDIESKINDLQEQLKNSNEKIKVLEEEKAALIERLDDAISKNEELTKKIEELQDIIDSSDNDLINKIEELEKEIDELNSQNKDLSDELDRLSNESSNLVNENIILKSEIARLESLLETANSTIEELRQVIADLKAENELLKQQIEDSKNTPNVPCPPSNNSNNSNDDYFKNIIDNLKKEIEELKKGQVGEDSIILTPGNDNIDNIIVEDTNEVIDDKITSRPGWEITDALENEWVKEIEISEVIKSEKTEELTIYAREEEKPQDVYIITVNVGGQVFSPTFSLDKTIHTGYTYKIQLANSNNAKVTYISDNKKVATVSKDGEISAIKKGKAIIVGQVESESQVYSFTVNVTVKDGGSNLNLKDDIIQTTADTPVVVMYKLVGENKTTKLDVQTNIKNAVVNYISSDSSIVVVDKNGNVYGKKKGNAIVTTVVSYDDMLYTYVTKIRVTDGTVDRDKWTYLTQD